jgi:hypothetical protein
MLDHPGRIDAHVVGHHVAGQANAVPVGAVAQVDVSRLAAQIVGNAVVEERIGRSHGVRLPQSCLMVFDARLRSHTPISHSELMPRAPAWPVLRRESRRAGRCGGRIAAQLRQPHVGALGDQHRAGHPGRVGRELLVFVRRIAEVGTSAWLTNDGHCCGGRARRSRRVELHPDGQLFFAQNLAGHQQEALQAVAEQRLPKLADDLKLVAERAGEPAPARAAIEQAHRLRAGQRNQRPRGKVLRQLRVTWR